MKTQWNALRKTITILLLPGIMVFISCKKETSCEGCSEGNKPPIAIAGPDQVITLPTDSVSLDGTASSDPDGTISEWLWTKISGPASFNIVNISNEKTTVKNLVAGAYQFELKVTDARGLFSKDTVALNVNASVIDTTDCGLHTDWEITVTLPIDSAFIDDYFRDDEGICVGYICGPATYSINGGWVKNLVPGVYYFRRYWINCVTESAIVKVTVLNDPNEPNTITYKKMLWEYNCAYTNGVNCQHLFVSRPRWPSDVNRSIEVHLQMDSLNNGQWFPLPSNTDGYNFWLDCWFTLNNCLSGFIVKVSPENRSWDGKKANLKIKIL